MRHFVLTRAVYGRGWTLDANRRRLAVSRAVTLPLMAAQTSREWTWIVALDPADPLLEERSAAFSEAAPEFVPLLWAPPTSPSAARWDRHGSSLGLVQRIAASAYRAPWRNAMDVGDDRVMMTRLDDDDGLAPDALARYQRAAPRARGRTILMLPSGVRIWRNRYSDVIRRRNAMHSLVAPKGDRVSIYDYGHAMCHKAAPVVMVDNKWGWIWVRHQDTISGWKRADTPLDARVKRTFPINWSDLA